MRLIDAEDIPYTMLYKENWIKGTGKEAQGAWKSDIDKMPTIDAVPIVRCKDCKWWVSSQCTDELKTGICKDKCASERSDGYCSHGERRSDEAD